MGVHMDGARFANALVATWRLACRDDLARRRRHPVARGDQERRARLRGGDVLRSRQGRGLCPTSASGPGRPCRKAASSAPRWRPGSPAACGSIWRGAPTRPRPSASPRGSPPRPACGSAFPTEANEVFVVAPDAALAAWREAGAKFHDWSTRSIAPELRAAGRRDDGASGRLVRDQQCTKSRRFSRLPTRRTEAAILSEDLRRGGGPCARSGAPLGELRRIHRRVRGRRLWRSLRWRAGAARRKVCSRSSAAVPRPMRSSASSTERAMRSPARWSLRGDV